AQLRNCLAHSETNGVPLDQSELMVLGFTHAELGAALLQHWNFSPRIVEAVRLHMGGMWELAGANTLAAQVADARTYALAAGFSPGVETYELDMDEEERGELLLSSPLAEALNALGGLDLVVQRV